ncbi:extensin family protein [Brevundimonas sp. SORGH_AS_0993]|uniref:extensin-like domain-containing protein n=1 Tax=Brevundimonas sp. SORGH_AS_0993 TaxID=3041794 RepID=UPI002788BE62|nr:extensin family protein [Brevundimonas sp. SORGH_AS_0993]MDQ1155204.1 hypothetical protein [Brevundimonas sp. SORGH_AS_0993]
MKRELAEVWTVLSEAGLMACALFGLLNALAPPQDLPWKPLNLDQPVGRATGLKIAAFDLERNASPQAVAERTLACMAVLEKAGVQVARATDRNDGGFCVVRGAVRIAGGDVTPLRPAGLTMQCPMALRYAVWDRQVLRPAAQALGSAPARVDSYGTYACRRIYGSQDRTARPSEHARANALDVAGVTLADGRRVRVLQDWDGQGPAGAQGAGFLRALKTGACGLFANVLSPEYNAAHKDHLHLDAASGGVCR